MTLKYIDLFCGGGGLGEGFKQAGYESAFHIDSNNWAIETIKLRECYYYLKKKGKLNYYYDYLKKNKGPITSEKLSKDNTNLMHILSEKIFQEKITDENMDIILNKIKHTLRNNNESIIIGGPPCQAYSLAKRSRMRKPLDNLKGIELQEAKVEHKLRVDNYLSDERHDLFKQYLKIIYRLRPTAFVYENVPGILTAQKKSGKDSRAQIIDLFNKDLNKNAGGYNLISINQPTETSLFSNKNNIVFKDFIVNASDYGVPQNRKRFILIGIRSDIKGGKDINLRELFESEVNKYRISKDADKITVKDAIWDLPRIKSGEGNDYFLNRKYNRYRSDYSDMLSCSDFGGIMNHFARNHMDKDLKRYKFFSEFAKINNKNANLYDLAENYPHLLPDHISAKDVISTHGQKNKKARYIDRFKVQLKNKQATTITAHISKDGHAFIHPIPSQNRSLTVREAARLQSFPDDYVFCGPRTEQFKQVGNAVPVILAKVIAKGINAVLKSYND